MSTVFPKLVSILINKPFLTILLRLLLLSFLLKELMDKKLSTSQIVKDQLIKKVPHKFTLIFQLTTKILLVIAILMVRIEIQARKSIYYQVVAVEPS